MPFEQRDVQGVNVQHQFLRRLIAMQSDEPFNQYLVQRIDIGMAYTRFDPGILPCLPIALA